MSGQWPPEWDDEDDSSGTEAGQPTAEADGRQAEVAAFLASVPAPALPAGIQSRISAAIAAEAASRAADGGNAARSTDGTETAGDTGDGTSEADGTGTTGAGGEPGSARPVGPATAPTRRRGRPGGRSGPRGGAGSHRGPGRGTTLTRRFLQFGPLLAVVLIVAGLGYVISLTGSSSSSSSATAGSAAAGSSSSSSAAAAAAAPEASATRSGAAAGSAPTDQAPNPAVTAPGNHGPQATPLFTVFASGTKYQQATLSGQVRGTLAALGPTPRPFATAPQAPALAGCVLHLTGGPSPRLVDRATYQGTAAYVIASSSHIWVVGTGCTAADPHLLASVPLAG